MSTSQPGADRWFAPLSHEYCRHENGDRFAYDFATGTAWQLNDATVDLLTSVRGGWQPGDPPPPVLAAHLDADTSTGDLHEALEALAEEGLTHRGLHPPEIPAAALQVVRALRWSDIRVRLLTIRAVPPRLGGLILHGARLTPLLALAALALSTWVLFGDYQKEGVARWRDFMDQAGMLEKVATPLLAILFLTLVHELGHALTAAEATGRPITLGIRVNHGIPQGFADVSATICTPRRRDRVAVVLGGLALETLAWFPFIPWVHTGKAPPFAFSVMLFGGGLSVLVNLLPFWKNDGYLLLEELTGIRDLMDRALAAAAQEFLGGHPAGERAWLAWLGLIHVHAMAAAAMLTAIFFGTLSNAQVPFTLLGLGVAGTILVQNYRRMLRIVRQPAAGSTA